MKLVTTWRPVWFTCFQHEKHACKIGALCQQGVEKVLFYSEPLPLDTRTLKSSSDCHELLWVACLFLFSLFVSSTKVTIITAFSSFQCFIFLVFFHEAAQQRPHQQAVPRTQAPRPGRWCCPVEIYDARGMASHMSHVSHVLTSIPPIGRNSIQFFSMPCNWHPKRHRTSRSW